MGKKENIGTNKTIAKNAIALYLRTLFTIFISLYTSRVLLMKLGETDFGVFSVVGGIAILFSFLSNSLTVATQRYLTLSLSHNDDTEYKQVFTTSLNCYIAIGVGILILAETIGLYIVNFVLDIPETRITAANYVYQFALFSFLLGLTNGPYRASIIAHEKFTYFSYTDIWVKILKLIIVFIMAISPGDKLIVYSALFMTVSLLRLSSDKIFCYYKFSGCRYIRYWNYIQFKSIMRFSGFSMLRSMSDVSISQGNNMIVNVYGGAIASASYGLANQVWGTVTGFFLNVQSAFSPQIIKNWGEQNISRFNSLIVNSAKFSSYMVMFIAIPLVVNMPFVLGLWLKDIPDYAIQFCSVTIFSCFISAVVNPLDTAILAIGKIQWYQIFSAVILASCVPFSLIAIGVGFNLVWVYIVRVVFQVFQLVYCSMYLRKMFAFDINRFTLIFLFNSIVLGCGIVISYLFMIMTGVEGFGSVVISTVTGWTFLIVAIWCFGLDKSQREVVKNRIKI